MARAVSTGLKRCCKHLLGPLFWRYFKGRERFITAVEFFFSQNGLALLYNEYDIHLKLSECNEHKTSFIATRVKTLSLFESLSHKAFILLVLTLEWKRPECS